MQNVRLEAGGQRSVFGAVAATHWRFGGETRSRYFRATARSSGRSIVAQIGWRAAGRVSWVCATAGDWAQRAGVAFAEGKGRGRPIVNLQRPISGPESGGSPAEK